MAKLAADIYSEALFSLGVEKDLVDSLMEEILALQELLQENPEYLSLLTHPGIGKEERTSILSATFENKVSDEMYGFLQVLMMKNRMGSILDIFAAYEAKYKEYHHVGIASVQSAAELTDEQKNRIHERLLATTSYESMEISYMTDPSLIGGLVIRIGDRVVDSSIRTKLDILQKQLLKTQL